MDRQTDMMKLIVAFRNFGNALNNEQLKSRRLMELFEVMSVKLKMYEICT